MDAERTRIATHCLAASHDGSLDFPAIIGQLLAAGFEGYAVDYRRGTTTYYLPDGDSLELRNPGEHPPVAAAFQAPSIEAAVREAQTLAPLLYLCGLHAEGDGGRLRRVHRLLFRAPRRLFRSHRGTACGTFPAAVTPPAVRHPPPGRTSRRRMRSRHRHSAPAR